jgi:hypothetical protein
MQTLFSRSTRSESTYSTVLNVYFIFARIPNSVEKPIFDSTTQNLWTVVLDRRGVVWVAWVVDVHRLSFLRYVVPDLTFNEFIFNFISCEVGG